MKKKNLIKVILGVTLLFVTRLTFAQSCDTLRNYDPQSSLYNFSLTTGYIFGHSTVSDGTNTYQDKDWAEPYNVSSSSQIRAVRFLPFKVQNNSGNATLTINVYSNNAGEPGTVIGSQVVSYDDLTNNIWNVVPFDNAVTVNGDFFVGYELDYSTPVDTFAISATKSPINYSKVYVTGVSPLGNTWNNTSDIFTDQNSNPLKSAFAFDVLLSSSSTPPVANFSLTNSKACLSGGFNVDASTSTGTIDKYEWLLTDDPITQIYVDNYGSQTDYIQPSAATAPAQQRLILLAYGACVSSGIYSLVTVYPDVSATLTPTDASCGNANGQISVSATGGSGTYSYKLDGGNPNTSGTFTNVSAGSHSVEIITDGDGCSVTEQTNIGSTPATPITVGADQTVCSGNSATLTASGNGTIEWFDGTTSLGTGTSQTVSPTTTKTYTATLTDGNGCTDTKSVTVTVNPTADASFNYASSTICLGSGNVTPTINSAGGTFTASTSGLNFADASTGEINMTTSSAGTYNVTYTLTGTCGSSSSQSITITSSPSASFTYPSTTYCQNDGTASPVFGNGSSAGTFSSTTGLTLDAGTGAVDFTTSNPGIYTVTNEIAASGSCPAVSETYDITINEVPNLNAGTDQSVCAGNDVTLSASSTTPNTTISWDNNVNDGVAFTPNATQTYTATATNNGCMATDQVTVTVNPIPTVDAGNNTTICLGDQITLSATSTPSNASISWDNSVTDGVAFTPSATTTYTATATNSGCMATDQVTITVNPLPTIDAGQDQTICAGDPVTLSATTTPSNTSVSWDNSVTDGVTFIPNVTTTYTSTATNNGCMATDQVTVTVNPIPTVNAGNDLTLCTTDAPVQLSGTPAGGDFSGNSVNNNTFDPAVGVGSYTITYSYTDANSCSNSSTLLITVDDCAGVKENEWTGLHISPNPANDYLTIEGAASISIQSVQMISSIGQIIRVPVTKVNNHTVKLNVSNVATGSYFIQLTTTKTRITKKVIIQ